MRRGRNPRTRLHLIRSHTVPILCWCFSATMFEKKPLQFPFVPYYLINGHPCLNMISVVEMFLDDFLLDKNWSLISASTHCDWSMNGPIHDLCTRLRWVLELRMMFIWCAPTLSCDAMRLQIRTGRRMPQRVDPNYWSCPAIAESHWWPEFYARKSGRYSPATYIKCFFVSYFESHAIDGALEQTKARMRPFIENVSVIVRFKGFCPRFNWIIEISTTNDTAAVILTTFAWKANILILCTDSDDRAIYFCAFRHPPSWTLCYRRQFVLSLNHTVMAGRTQTLSSTDSKLLRRRQPQQSSLVCFVNAI